jgi:glycosyltransferase involved in cell wall biosynthesis
MTPPSPIRIGIDGRILSHYEMRGFARYTVELFRAMKEVAGDSIDLYSFSPELPAPEFLAALQIEPIVFSARREFLWEQSALPRRLRHHRIDVFHATANRGLPYRQVCKYVVTCHDIIDRLPEYSEGDRWRGRLRKKYADFISRHSASRYITVSEFSKRDICRFHRLPPARVSVIYNAANPRFFQTLSPEEIGRVQMRYHLPASYFLFLGGFDKRKNVAALIDAFARLEGDDAQNAGEVRNSSPDLVLAGEHKWEFAAIASKIQSLGLSQRIFCPGQIADEDLPALYQGALAFINPSRYEGFGLQLVEAMASGVPVLASETTSLPEVLGGAGLLFNPDDPDSIATAIMRVISDSDLCASLAESGRERARHFSWRKAAQQTLDLYRDLLASENARGPEANQTLRPTALSSSNSPRASDEVAAASERDR